MVKKGQFIWNKRNDISTEEIIKLYFEDKMSCQDITTGWIVNMKKLFVLLSVTLIITFIVPFGAAFGPNTHNWLSNNILNNPEIEIGKLCSSTEENKAAYLLGVTVPDLAVIYYYEEGGKEYKISHNWNFQQEILGQALTDDEKCLAYGIMAHEGEDGISHNFFVPDIITRLRIPNFFSHPLGEKKVDSALVLKYPELLTSTPHIMDALDGPKGDRYIQMIEVALGENSQINVRDELTKLKIAISGQNFYNTQFKPTGGTWIFRTYYYIDKLTNFLAPYIGTVNFANAEYYLNQAEEQTVNVFNNPGSKYQISPHGFEELSKANEKTSNSLTIILIACAGIPIILTIRAKSKKKKYWYLYLSLISALLLAVVVGVYVLL